MGIRSEIGSSADHAGLQNPLNCTPYSMALLGAWPSGRDTLTGTMMYSRINLRVHPRKEIDFSQKSIGLLVTPGILRMKDPSEIDRLLEDVDTSTFH